MTNQFCNHGEGIPEFITWIMQANFFITPPPRSTTMIYKPKSTLFLIDRVSIIGLFPVIIVRLILLEGVDTIDLPTPHKNKQRV